jgi:hypothetical protein
MNLTGTKLVEKFTVLGVASRRVPASFAYKGAMSIELALDGSLTPLCGPLWQVWLSSRSGPAL